MLIGRYVLDARILERGRYFGNHVLEFLNEGCAFGFTFFLLVMVTNKPESRNDDYF